MAKLPPMTPEQRARRDQAWEYRQQLRKMGYKPGEADRLALAAFPDVTYDQLNPGHGKSTFEKIVGGIGDVVKMAAPLATLIPGVGPLAAAAIGAVGGLAGNLNDDDGFRGALGDILLGGLAGGAGGFALEKLPAVLQAARSIVPGAAGAAGAAADAAGGGFNLGNVLRSAGRFLLDNPELILGGVSAIAGARQYGEADEARRLAIDFAMRDAEERRALRGAALERLMGPGPERPDVSDVFAGSSNPYARPLTLTQPRAAEPLAAGPDTQPPIVPELRGGTQQPAMPPLPPPPDPEARRRALRSAVRQAAALSFARV